MKIFDSHAHLNDPQFKKDLEEVIGRAREKGVEAILIPGYDLSSSIKSIEISESYSFYSSIGLHPHDAKKFTGNTLSEYERLLHRSNRVVAIGEIGLDFYKNYSPPDIQIKVFQEFLTLSAKHNLPVILHVRNAFDETFRILEDFEKNLPAIIFHCFSGGPEEIVQLSSKPNYFISFSATITYKNTKLIKAAEILPLEKILVETDAPYLTPSTLKGRNEPAYVVEVVKKLSEIKKIDPGKLAEITYSNTIRAFRIEK
ncbi:MAG: TatD family hydrolase [candidate division WOR-3 bacterium]